MFTIFSNSLSIISIMPSSPTIVLLLSSTRETSGGVPALPGVVGGVVMPPGVVGGVVMPPLPGVVGGVVIFGSVVGGVNVLVRIGIGVVDGGTAVLSGANNGTATTVGAVPALGRAGTSGVAVGVVDADAALVAVDDDTIGDVVEGVMGELAISGVVAGLTVAGVVTDVDGATLPSFPTLAITAMSLSEQTNKQTKNKKQD